MPLKLPQPGELPRLDFSGASLFQPDTPVPAKDETVDQIYTSWSQTQSPADAGRLLKKLQPSIQHSVRKYIGEPDGISTAYAKRLVLDSLPRYDPKQSKLETFVDRQIQPIIRWQSRRKNVAKMPDAVRMQAIAVGNASRELARESGREASTREIADRTGLPVSKVEHIRKIDRGLLVGSQEFGNEGDELVMIEDQAVVDDEQSSMSWLRFVRDDLSPIDQSILEHTTGLGGAEVLSNQDLAIRLKLSPGAISQRKLRIQQILDREEELSPFI